MKRNVLLLPLLIFLLTAEALLWQLVCNALGDDPAAIESALTQGKTVLLNVWVLNQLSVQGIMVVGLNYKDNLQKTVTWLRELGNPYALSLFDGDGMLELDLGVYGAPETFLIDGKGIIRYRHMGDLNTRVWKSEIKPLWDKYNRKAAPTTRC